MSSRHRWYAALTIVAVFGATLSSLGSRPAVASTPTTRGNVVGGFGQNAEGELGDGTTAIRAKVVQTGVPDAIAVAMQAESALALRPDGTVWAWGHNDEGQLGDNTTTDRATPAQVPGLTNVVSIAEGGFHSLAARSDGKVWAWGNNDYGQLGDNTTTDHFAPTEVPVLKDIVKVAAGHVWSLALSSTGVLWAWGANGTGQLGDNSTTQRLTPTKVQVLTNVVSMAAGFDHSVAVKSDGTVWAWGSNDHGEIGDGSAVAQRNLPTQSVGLTGIADVAAGRDFTLARGTNKTVWAWGLNEIGQLGDGSLTQRFIPTQVPGLGNVLQIAAGEAHSVAAKGDGTAVAWGAGGEGQLGDNTRQPRLTPTSVVALNGVTGVAAGRFSTLVMAEPAVLRVVTDPPVPSQISVDGTIGTTWGLWVNLLPTTHTVSFSHVTGFDDAAPVTQLLQAGVTNTITGVFARRGYLHVKTDPPVAATIYVDGTPREDWAMWTDMPPGSYDICFGSVEGYATPPCQEATVIAGLTTELNVPYTTGGAGPARLVGAVGRNDFGHLGIGTTSSPRSRIVPTHVPDAISVVAGGQHSLALRADGTVWAWGQNDFGQLGDGTTVPRPTPFQLPLTDIVAIAAGNKFSLALTENGTVWSWGENTHGQLGEGTFDDRWSPVEIPSLAGITQIVAGLNFALALDNDGTIWGWGDNASKQTGNFVEPESAIPHEILYGLTVTEIAAGAFHSVALDNAGNVYTWGGNGSGQRGNGMTGAPNGIAHVKSFTPAVTDIAAGGLHNLVRLADGTVWAWGDSALGAMGDGTLTVHPTPTQVPGLFGVDSVWSGPLSQMSYAIRNDGTVRGWGDNRQGQLGDGTTTVRTTPIAIPELTGAVAISSGASHALFLARPALLRVTSNPAVPTQISVDGNIADTWGTLYMKVFPGPHTVSFTHVEGYDEPGPETKVAVADFSNLVKGVFTKRGYLWAVNTAGDLDATIWVDGKPSASFGIWTDIALGDHTLCFSSIAYLNTPACQTVSVVANSTPHYKGEYT